MKNKYIIKGNITEIMLYNCDEIVLIDTEDLHIFEEINYKMNKDNLGYAHISIYNGIDKKGKKKTKGKWVHILIMGEDNVKRGKSVVDHINHNKLDNRKENLRIITQSQNMMNRPKKNNNNTSGYRNVSWDKSINKWAVQLQVNGKHKTLGQFDDVDEAGKFAKEMREKYYGEFAGKD